MIRNPRLCRPSGTDPPALFGSRDAPTTAMVLALSRISCELRLTRTPSTSLGRLFRSWQLREFRTSGSNEALGVAEFRTADVSGLKSVSPLETRRQEEAVRR